MTHKFFAKLLGLFVLLLVLHTLVMGFVFHSLVDQAASRNLHLVGRAALWAGLVALLFAIPLAAWVANRISWRLESVVASYTPLAREEYGPARPWSMTTAA